MSQFPLYTRAVVMVHGKSELELVRQMRYLHLNIGYYENRNSGVCIGSIMDNFKGQILSTQKDFCVKYPSVNRNSKNLTDFSYFIIMDKDSTSESTYQDYISKNIFNGHWLQPYIIPIFNEPRLEKVLEKARIIDQEPSEDHKIDTIKHIFEKPLEWAGTSNPIAVVKEFANRIRPFQETNMELFFDFCVEWAQKRS